jgi:excisionase family DNA binding protein
MSEVVKYLTQEEVAEELRVSVDTVTRWIKSGQLVGYRISRNAYRIKRQDLDAFMEARKSTKPPLAEES